MSASGPVDHAEEFSEHGVQRRLGGFSLQILLALALAFSVYQLVVAAFHPFSSLVTRALHVGFLLALTFIIYPAFKRGKKTLYIMYQSLIAGARQALPVGVACAIVGVIIGILTLTGAASSFAGFILRVGEHSLFLSLFLTMLVCLLLGMGIPTIPNYIITSAIAAPALLTLGVPLIVSHMFVFYFGIMADLTPPVALAAFAASSIAKESAMKIGLKAVQIAIAGFVVPYMAVYDNALMLQGDPTVLAVAYIVGKALLAIALWGAAAGAGLLIAALPLTDEIGILMGGAFIAWRFWQARRRLASADF
ncbi:MAG: TRAP transporter large permease subunit [Rhodocyclaceae bacterium]